MVWGRNCATLIAAFAWGLLSAEPALVAALESNDSATVLKLISATLEDCAGKREQLARAASHDPDNSPAKIIRLANYGDTYPPMSRAAGEQAIVLVELLVDQLGNPRFAHVARAIPASRKSRFAESALATVRNSKWTPAHRAGQAVPSWKNLKEKFIIQAQGSMGNILSETKLAEQMESAGSGKLESIALISYLNSVASNEVVLTSEERSRYLATAAMAGERTAALRVAQLLSSPECAKPPAALDMLRQQALSGYSAAEMVRAGQMMRANDPSTYSEISSLLHGAANSNDEFIQLWATGLLATAPAMELRDPPFALTKALTFKQERDPDFLEALAAAQAANAHFDAAVGAEQRALDAAKAMRWNDSAMRVRLAAYQAGQSWTGYLCDCTQLVPGEGI